MAQLCLVQTKINLKLDHDQMELIKNLQKCIELDPGNLFYQKALPKHYYQFGKVEEAKEILRNSLKQNSLDFPAIQIFADCLLSQGNYQGSLKGFNKMYEKEKEVFGTHKMLSVLIWFYRGLGRLAEFEQTLKSL